MENIYFKRVYVKPEPWTQSIVQNGPKCKYIHTTKLEIGYYEC